MRFSRRNRGDKTPKVEKIVDASTILPEKPAENTAKNESEKPVENSTKNPKKSTENAEKSTKKSKKREKRSRLTPGARNLVILGVVATLIAITTTTIGLAIYHLSGDIYLDRSRPGYLPDEAEVEEEAEAQPEEYNFEKSGKIDAATLKEYLEHLSEELNAVDGYKNPYSSAPISDEHLGIPQE